MIVTVSVILPVYNRATSLGRAISSVLNQSFRELELIVVDDASEVNLTRITSEFNDPRLRYIRLEENGGVSVARNVGLQRASGEFIAFQDSDDFWLPNKLVNQIELFNSAAHDVVVIAHSKILYGSDEFGAYGADKVSLRPPPHSKLRKDEDQDKKFLKENRISLQNSLFRANCYPSSDWFDPLVRSNADWAFTAILAQHTKIVEHPEPLVLAFSSPDSISKQKRLKTIGMCRILKRNRDVYNKYPSCRGLMMWRIGRNLSQQGKKRSARRFCTAGLRLHPHLLLDISLAWLERRLAKIILSIRS